MGVATLGINIGGVSRSKSITRTGTTWHDDVTLAAGQAGTLSTRTDEDTGILSVVSHGILDTDTVDVAWEDTDSINRNRARMTVSSVTTDTISVDGGSGVDFPIEDYVIVVGKRVAIDFAANGDKVEMISLYSEPPAGETDSRAMVDFVTSAPATIKAFDLNDDEPFLWANNSPIDNPLASGTVANIELSSLAAQASTVYLEIVYDAGP